MFSARRLLRHAKETFGLHPYWTWKGWALHGFVVVVLFVFLWGISAMGALRTFVPNTLQITGWPGSDRTYLVLFQNNTELRATGGFISAFAVVDFKNGFPSSIDFQDVYGEVDDHDYVSPPYPMDVLLEANSTTYAGHSFRDANYNPDFTETVVEVLEFYNINNPEVDVDGVFAVNFSVLEDVVALYAPVTVDRLELTKDNLFETLETAVSDIDLHNLEALDTRKDIIKDFAHVVIGDMLFTPWRWRSLSEVITQSLNEKSILIYFENDRLGEKVKNLGWDGSFPDDSVNADRLAVNVSNFGGMKSDRYITREVHYTVDITNEYDEFGERLIYGNLEITLRHYGDYNTPLSGGWKGYIRAFVPMGSELIESSTGESTQEFITNHVGWGDVGYLNPDETITYTYNFRLNPDYFQDDQYNLMLIKQPGTYGDFYEVVVKAPQGQNIESDNMETRENVAYFQGNLLHDVDLSLTVLPDEAGPRIYYHEITDLNVIELSFSETLSPESVEDPLNYEITDLNVTDSTINDIITIDFITIDGGTIRIYTKGMDYQYEEQFQIILKNIRDLSGNTITPNPRTITVVQRLEEE
ncbi:MAG: DUF4012 domain-containing protein [Candidatus Peregrinibacteria bacterium]|nr:DUF4012 domain-containing protein [Candidatus Peregrinibacteria bacterium]